MGRFYIRRTDVRLFPTSVMEGKRKNWVKLELCLHRHLAGGQLLQRREDEFDFNPESLIHLGPGGGYISIGL